MLLWRMPVDEDERRPKVCVKGRDTRHHRITESRAPRRRKTSITDPYVSYFT